MADDARRWLADFDADAPLSEALSPPLAWYTDEAFAELERDAVFGRHWLWAGRNAAIQNPGSFLTCDLAGEPVLLIADEVGQARALSNVCRHRACILVDEPAGHRTRLRCPYHGWTYDLAGRLRGAPEFDGVAHFRRDDHGLPEFAHEEWGLWRFVNLAANASPLRDAIAPLRAYLPDERLRAFQFAARREYELACNWKIFVDNYLDGGYHVHVVHPDLAAVLDYAHYRTEVFPWASLQLSPMNTGSAHGDPLARPAVRGGEYAYYGWLYPNFMINVYEGVMDINIVLPIDARHCKVIFEFYFTDMSEKSAEFRLQSMDTADRIQREDVGVCELVQRGLRGRHARPGRYSVRREAGARHFHQLLSQSLRAVAE